MEVNLQKNTPNKPELVRGTNHGLQVFTLYREALTAAAGPGSVGVVE
jgi:hypothetical protein